MTKGISLFAVLTGCLLFVVSCGYPGFVLKRELAAYHGDGTLSHIPSPGFLVPEGFVLNFEGFQLSDGLNAEYSFTNLPGINFQYSLNFVCDTVISHATRQAIEIRIFLVANDGPVLWNVQSRLSDWVETRIGSGDSATRWFHYMKFAPSRGIVASCHFIPQKEKTYKLSIECSILDKSVLPAIEGQTGKFRLRTGGYK